MADRDQINDARRNALEAQGFLGTIGDMTKAWLLSEGATGDHVTDLWDSLFDVKGIAPGARPDREVTFYLSEGAVGGDVNALELDYWQKALP